MNGSKQTKKMSALLILIMFLLGLIVSGCGGADSDTVAHEQDPGVDLIASTVAIIMMDCSDGQGVQVLSPTLTVCVGGSEVMEVIEYSRGSLVTQASGNQLIVTHGHGLLGQRHDLSDGSGWPDLVYFYGQDGILTVPGEIILGPMGWIDEARSDSGTTYIDIPADVDLSTIGALATLSSQVVKVGMVVQVVYRLEPGCYTLDSSCAAVAEATVTEAGLLAPYDLPAYRMVTDVSGIYEGSSGGGVYLNGELIGNIWGAPLTAATVQIDSSSAVVDEMAVPHSTQ